MQIPLSFPVFYQAVIKQQLTLKQYDAVNLLLLGKRYNDCVEIQISQSMAANYVSGKKKVSKDIIAQLLDCPPAECKRRLQALGLQNLDQGVFCLKFMLYNGEIQLNDYSGFDGFRPPPGLRVLPIDFTLLLFPSQTIYRTQEYAV